jgi:cyclopropane-fatty-acyl-phospholipid synthase
MNTSDGFTTALKELLLSADIQIDGTRPWDIQVHNPGFYKRVIKEQAMGLGESYMDGWWDCNSLDEFFNRVLTNDLQAKMKINPSIVIYGLSSKILNFQSKQHLKRGVAVSYERGLDLYLSFLDPYNQYSCGYFKDTNDLNKAQEQKMDLICRKLYLAKQDHVLDIGCGWGGLARFIGERIGSNVTGINISRQQLEYARKNSSSYGARFIELDYRDLLQEQYREKYDKIVSVGMQEHVGYKNYRRYMESAGHCLKENGLFLLHVIGSNTSSTGTLTNTWLTKYIFPDSMTPSLKQISEAAEGIFIVEDVHNFGVYYDHTLVAWANNFENNWEKLKQHYDERFHRMWRYYLLSCAGGFRARYNQLWQIVFSKAGGKREYVSVR